MSNVVGKAGLRSALDVVTSLVLIAAGVTLIYRHLTSSPVGAQAELNAPVEPVSIEGAPIRGSEDAGVVMIVYSDFQCPFCGRFTREVLPELDRRYVAIGQVALAFRHFPLPIHPQAVGAAVSAECAGRQGLFWEMHDRLFAENSLDAGTLFALPESMDLDRRAFDDCVLDQGVVERVQASADEAIGLGIRATPSFLIGDRLENGRVRVSRTLSGVRPVDDFVEHLDAVLTGDSGGWRSWVRRLAS